MWNTFDRFIEKWMALVTPFCLLLGVLFPDIAKLGLPFVPFVFAFMTFIGSLKSGFRDVADVFRNPMMLLTALLIIHVVMPSAACGLGHLLFPHNINLITGMVLEFSVPTAVVALMWMSIYNGNSSLSISLVVVDTILAPFLIPLSLRVLIGSNIAIDLSKMMEELIFMIALPAIGAMCLKQFSRKKTAERLSVQLKPFSKICLMFVVTANSSKAAPFIRHMNCQRLLTMGAILFLAASGYAVGWLVSRLLKQNHATTVSMVFGTGMRNISAGAVIATAYFPPETVFPVIIATLFQQVLAATFGKLLQKAQSFSS